MCSGGEPGHEGSAAGRNRVGPMEQRTAAFGVTTLALIAIAATAVRSPAPVIPAAPTPAGPAPAALSPAKPATAKLAHAPTFTRGQDLLRRFLGGDSLRLKLRPYDFDVLIATLPD